MYQSNMNVPMMNGNDIIIYGFSNLTRRFDEEFFSNIEKHQKCHILAIVDKFLEPQPEKKTFDGFPLISPDEFYEKYSDKVCADFELD